MKNKSAKLLVALAFSLMVSVPSYARGFGGGGFDRGGFGGGGFDRGGFDRGGFDRGAYGGGFDRGFDNADRAGVARAQPVDGGWNGNGVKNYSYGGGFNKIAQPEAGAYHPNVNQFTAHNPSQLSSDGGLGNIASQNRMTNYHPQNFDQNNLSAQGESVRNSFDHTTNVNNYGGYHGNYANYPRGAYNHPYGANGYHPYGGYGYHGAYGYHPNGFYGYPGGWGSAGFMEASMWTCMGVSSLTSFLGLAALSGNKGNASNVTYEGGNTYINTLPAQDYYQQGQQLAGMAGGDVSSSPQMTAMAANDAMPQISSDAPSSVTPGAAEKWEPLGVYSLCEPGQKQSTTLFQLAINKDGILRGNYMNEITNEKAQVHGALDKNTQRLSWTIGSNPGTVFSTTLAELMKEDSKVVVQFGPSQTQQMAFIRLKAPKKSELPPQTS